MDTTTQIEMLDEIAPLTYKLKLDKITGNWYVSKLDQHGMSVVSESVSKDRTKAINCLKSLKG